MRSIKIVEVGPRDGLQNESEQVPVEIKLEYIRALAAAGLKHIEATSFVHPKWVPQLADAAEVVKALDHHGEVEYSVLVPNLKGLERAVQAEVSRIAVFAAASEAFSQKNLNRSIDETLREYREVVQRALQAGISVRAYVSTCFGCPYQGAVEPEAVRGITEQFLEMGADEVSLGDTIGVAVPPDIERVVKRLDVDRIALHLHDTSGTALANVWMGLQLGVRVFDGASGGLGGCPYAPGASGNLATEDLVYLLERSGYPTGVNLERLAQASLVLERHLGRRLPSRQLRRLSAKIPMR